MLVSFVELTRKCCYDKTLVKQEMFVGDRTQRFVCDVASLV